MPLVKRVDVEIQAKGFEDAKLKIDRLRVASEELGREHPEIKPQIEGQRALIEARLLRAAIKRELSGALDTGGSGGLFGKLSGGLSSLLTSAGGGLANAPWIGGLIPGAAASNPYAAAGVLAAATVSAGALLTEVAGLVSGFAAASAGVGAFALVAMPAFSNVRQDATKLVGAWDALQLAQDKFALDPTKTTQKALQTAQLNLKAIQMSLGQDAGPAALQVLKLRDAYTQLTNSLNPVVYKVLGDALKAITTLIPDLRPFAQAGGQAIDGLLGRVQKFFQSADFKKWLDQFVKLVGPSITAIGDGIGKVTIAVGKLLTTMSAHDVVHAINIAFDIIVGAINAVYWAVKAAMFVWDKFTTALSITFRNIVKWSQQAVDFFVKQMTRVLDAAAKAFGWIPGLGPLLIAADDAFHHWADQSVGYIGAVNTALAGTAAGVQGVGNALAGVAASVSQLPAVPGLGAKPHAAGGFTSAGWSLVGERGPELVRFPAGSQVYPAGQTAGMLGGMTINVYVPPTVNPKEAGRQVAQLILAHTKSGGRLYPQGVKPA